MAFAEATSWQETKNPPLPRLRRDKGGRWKHAESAVIRHGESVLLQPDQ